MNALCAGAAKQRITPDLDAGPVFLAGFQGNRRATSVHDDLYVRVLALALEDGPPARPPSYFCLAVCDLIGLLHTDVLAIRQALQKQNVDTRGLVIASTHVHSGPDTIGLWGPNRFRSGVSPVYRATLVEQIAGAVSKAVEDLRPARLHIGRTELDRWLKNARHPEIVDRELSVLQVTALTGEPICTLANLACHPEVMFGENTSITADYAGATCQAIENETGGIGILASADLGGMMTPDVSGDERTFETVRRMGEDVAQAALQAIDGSVPCQPTKWHMARRTVHIPLQNPLFRFGRWIGVLEGLKGSDRHQITTEVSLLDLGILRMVTIPGELLPEPGLHLREMLRTPCRFLIGLADDELGYLLPSREFVYPRNPFRPGAHYEETMSVSRFAVPLLMEAWAALIAESSIVEPHT